MSKYQGMGDLVSFVYSLITVIVFAFVIVTLAGIAIFYQAYVVKAEQLEIRLKECQGK